MVRCSTFAFRIIYVYVLYVEKLDIMTMHFESGPTYSCVQYCPPVEVYALRNFMSIQYNDTDNSAEPEPKNTGGKGYRNSKVDSSTRPGA